MNPIDLLKRYGITDLTPGEEAELSRELCAAYHMDEAAASSRMCSEGGDDQRNAEHRSSGSREVVPDSLHGAQSRPDRVAIHGPLGFTRVQGPRIPARR